MTIDEIILAARNKYNSIGDTFYSDAELVGLIYEACMKLAVEAKCIENTFSTVSVADQREYSYPTNVVSIRRVEYAGAKLQLIDFTQDDSVTGYNAETTSTGTPQYYSIWDETIYLRPTPATDGDELKIFGFCEPSTLTVTSSLDVPSMFHPDITNYVVSEMCDKDENDRFAQKYFEKWEIGLQKAIQWAQKKKRADKLATVKTDDMGGYFKLP